MRLGLFGGAFDPPHIGHVALVRAAKEALGLDRVIVVVVAAPGHKQVGTPPDVRDRKSTRLNSSHASTSYAVFCLTKKIFSSGKLVIAAVSLTTSKSAPTLPRKSPWSKSHCPVTIGSPALAAPALATAQTHRHRPS